MNHPLTQRSMERSSWPGVRLSCRPICRTVVTTALTEAIHAQLLWEHLLLDMPLKWRIDAQAQDIRQALIRKEESS